MGRRASGLSPQARATERRLRLPRLPQGGEARCWNPISSRPKSAATSRPKCSTSRSSTIGAAATQIADASTGAVGTDSIGGERRAHTSEWSTPRRSQPAPSPVAALRRRQRRHHALTGAGRAGRHELPRARMHHQLPSRCALPTRGPRRGLHPARAPAPRRSAARRHDHEQRQANGTGRLRGQAGCSRGHGTRPRLPPRAAAAPPPPKPGTGGVRQPSHADRRPSHGECLGTLRAGPCRPQPPCPAQAREPRPTALGPLSMRLGSTVRLSVDLLNATLVSAANALGGHGLAGTPRMRVRVMAAGHHRPLARGHDSPLASDGELRASSPLKRARLRLRLLERSVCRSIVADVHGRRCKREYKTAKGGREKFCSFRCLRETPLLLLRPHQPVNSANVRQAKMRLWPPAGSVRGHRSASPSAPRERPRAARRPGARPRGDGR